MNVKVISASILLISAGAFAAPKSLTIDPVATKVEWKATKKVGSSHHGTVPVKSGELQVEKNEIKGGEVVISIADLKDDDLTDPDTNTKLTGHLKSEDFFNVAKDPTSTLKIKSVTAITGDKDGNTHKVAGDITIRGVTQPIEFPAKLAISEEKVSGTGKITIDRTKFGLKYGSESFFKNLGDKVINNEFEVSIDLATKGAEAAHEKATEVKKDKKAKKEKASK